MTRPGDFSVPATAVFLIMFGVEVATIGLAVSWFDDPLVIVLVTVAWVGGIIHERVRVRAHRSIQ